MKVPKYIQKSIHLSSMHNEIANKENAKIRDWMEKNGLVEDVGSYDNLIDCIEVSNNPTELIRWFESL